MHTESGADGRICRRETLPAETMNKALNLHNKLVHELLSKHNGHEAATEGDSVTAAFGSPWDALAFAQVRTVWLEGQGLHPRSAS